MGLEREQRERIKEEKGWEGKTTREATKVIFHYFHVQRSHTYDINSRSNSTGEGHTVTGLLGSQTLGVRFRESARCQVVQTLLHSGAHRPAAGPGTPLRPPASQPHSPHFKWTNTDWSTAYRFGVRKIWVPLAMGPEHAGKPDRLHTRL